MVVLELVEEVVVEAHGTGEVLGVGLAQGRGNVECLQGIKEIVQHLTMG